MVYVFDAYCGWCFGFTPALARVWEASRDRIPFHVISGGLFIGRGRYPIGTYPFITEANRRIGETTGAAFGAAYRRVLEEGTLELDSEAAAAGFAALRAQAPHRAVEIAAAQQRAFFIDGLSLSDRETYRSLAATLGLDPAGALAFLDGPEAPAAARADFTRARALGATAFPALLACRGGRVLRLPTMGVPADDITARLREDWARP